jgi:hypothetical protein
VRVFASAAAGFRIGSNIRSVSDAVLGQNPFGMTLIRILDPAADGGRREDSNVAKALVMAEIARIVEGGHALLGMLESGTLELRLATGEIFHLGEDAVTRIA